MVAGWLVLATLVFPKNRRPVSEGVQLYLNRETLEPTTTFELRFDEPVVSPEIIGKPAGDSPLVIRPQIAGEFVWLSTRSGVFTPSEPPVLNQTYQFTLKSGLRNSEGEKVKARLFQTLSTPNFGITAVRSNFYRAPDLPLFPALLLQFNDEVSLEKSVSRIWFVNDSGMRIPAQISWFNRTNQVHNSLAYGWFAPPLEMIWREYSLPKMEKATRRLVGPVAPDVDSYYIKHRLVVEPASPLPPADNWKLQIAKGIPSLDGRLRTVETIKIPLGSVQPFVVARTWTGSRLNAERTLAIQLSKPVSQEVNSNTVWRWISINPMPQCTASVNGDTFLISGKFELFQPYQLTIKAGLPAFEPTELKMSYTRTNITFHPMEPRVFLPSFYEEQLSAGRRKYELATLNLSNVTVRGKSLDSRQVIHGLRGYMGYFKRTKGSPYAEIDYNLLAGRTIFQTNLAAVAPIDFSRKFTLNWDELLSGKPAGVVFLEAVGSTNDLIQVAGSQSLVQLTDLCLVWKVFNSNVLVWTTSYRTGRPVEGATVNLMSDENELLCSKVSDKHGLTELALPADKKQSFWLLAQKDGDLRATPLAGNGMASELSLYRFFNLPRHAFSTPIDATKIMLFSDRDAYRPKEVLHLKALARNGDGLCLKIPELETFELQCTDSRGNVWLQTNVQFSHLGSLSMDLALPSGPLGNYRIELRNATNPLPVATHYFELAEYQPNAFEIQFAPKQEYMAGEQIELPLQARYYMGKPLYKARVKWRLSLDDTQFEPEGFADFIFTDGANCWHHRESQNSASIEGETIYNDAKGVILKPDVPINPKFPQPRSANLCIEITDVNQQTLSRSASFTRHSSDFYLGIRRFERAVEAGRPQPFSIVAVNANGIPLESKIKAQVQIQRIEWHTVKVQGTGGSMMVRNEYELYPVAEMEVETEPVRIFGGKAFLVSELEPGNVARQPAQFTVNQPGDYVLKIQARDPAGRQILTVTCFSAIGEGPASWSYRAGNAIELVPDKEKYKPGDESVILVKTPVGGTALVTIERESVLTSFTTNISAGAPTIKVPIKPEYGPNVYVGVMLIRGFESTGKKNKMPEYWSGYCDLEIEYARKLDVTVSTGRPYYQPGQEVTAQAMVAEYSGAPVKDAEVTLYAVDEGVLSLTGYETPEPCAFFYKPQPISVRTCITLPNLLPEDPDELRFANKGFIIGGGGRERIRNNFAACAFWNATLLTGPDGRVVARFNAPDSLSQFRVIAVAHTLRHQFGSGECGFRIHKPLMLQPAIPLYANIGDRIWARAIVHNQTDTASQIEVSLELDGKAAFDSGISNKLLQIPAHGSMPVDFPVVFKNAGQSKWIWRAKIKGDGDTYTDAVQSTVEIGYPQPRLREVHLARVESGSTNLFANVNPQLLESEGKVCVLISNTRLIELREAAERLLNYPYGCVEQTVSAMLPWLALKDFDDILKRASRRQLNAEIAVQAGINNLMKMQVGDGGLGYWPGSSSSYPWCSAYGGMALVLARSNGYSVPNKSLEDLLKYLAGQLQSTTTSRDPEDLAVKCLAFYVLALAGRAEDSMQEALLLKKYLLDAESRALLALGILTRGGPKLEAERLLLDPLPRKSFFDNLFGCPERESAIRLLAMNRIMPNDPKLDILVSEFLAMQKAGHWHTTQGNAWAILALADYAQRVEGAPKPCSGELVFGNQRQVVDLPAGAKVAELSFAWDAGSATRSLELRKTSGFRLYSEIQIEARPSPGLFPRQDRGFSLSRSYSIYNGQDILMPFTNATVGDMVLVELQLVSHQKSAFVAIDDALPAILEPVNIRFNPHIPIPHGSAFEDLFLDYREARPDRVLFFCNSLPRGKYKIRYLARVRTAGDVTAPPAIVEEMYHPEKFGSTEALRFSSKAGTWE